MFSFLRALFRTHASGIALSLVLLVALVLRLVGLRFGLPYIYHPDEPAIIGPVRVMMQTGDFNPHWFNWPSFYIYIQLAVASARYFYGVSKGQFDAVTGMAMQHFYPAGRLATVLFGVATVYLVFLVGRRLFSKSVGIVAALLLAVSFLHVKDSHYITVDVPATFFVLLSFFFSLLIFQEGKLKDYLFAGLFAGLAASTKYNGILILLSLFGAHFLGKQKPYLNRKLAVGVLSAAFGFLIGNPYALLDLPNFLNGVAFDIYHYTHGHLGYEGSNNWLFYLNYLFREGVGPGIFISAVGGLVLILVKRDIKLLFVSLFPLIYFILISNYKVRFVRNIMPVIPFLSLVAAYFFLEGFRWLKERTALNKIVDYMIFGILLLAVIAVPFIRSLQFDIGSSLLPTRTLAAAWIEKNIPKGSKIAANEYGPPLGDDHVVSTGNLTDYPFQFYRERGYDYLVLSSGDYGRFFREPERYADIVRRYKEFFEKGKLVKSFNGDSRVEEFLSPKISIYEVR